MNNHFHILFAPYVSHDVLQIFALLGVPLLAFALIKRGKGAWARLLAFALLFLALLNPSVIEEQREPLHDTALIVVDDSASMRINNRADLVTKTLAALTPKLASLNALDTEVLHVKGNDETHLFASIEAKLATMPQDRLAGIIAITDGQIHDLWAKPTSAPFHGLITGKHDEFDRRLSIKQAPAYGFVGKSVELTLRIDDEPHNASDMATVKLTFDNGESQDMTIPVGKDVPLTIPVNHAGSNLFVLSTPATDNEITDINNTTSININGIRDRLRVLLVSGQPHIGGRTWRNFLKADPAVDLVHFTILRSPNKVDLTPNTEMALIAFPAQELFDAKLSSFDLIILDRFRQRSLVPDNYMENIARYVEQGGALLVSSATDEAIPQITYSPLARILPAEPTGNLLTGSFVPDFTDAGLRHPVTNSLTQIAPRKDWGPWFRQLDSRVHSGDVLMKGLQDKPLLVLNHVGKGRVAQILSDQFWLWAHDYKNGGPQGEMLRRIAHWLVQEPELDETALRARGETADEGWQLVITKQSLQDVSANVSITDPKGNVTQATLEAGKQPGVLSAFVPVTQMGIYQVKDDNQAVTALIGPANAPEYSAMRATDEKLAPIAKATGGAIPWLGDSAMPDIKRVGVHSPTSGWNWIGLRENGQYKVTGSKAYPLLPPWAVLALVLIAALWAWHREGKN